jgi:hypothetical protein
MSKETKLEVLDADPPDIPEETRRYLRGDKKGRLWVVAVLAPGGSIPLASWKGSGSLTVLAAGALSLFVADVGNALSTARLEYPRGVGTTQLRLTVRVPVGRNTMAVGTTTVTVFDSAGATVATFSYGPGIDGTQGPTIFPVAMSAGERFDVEVSNPGNAGDIGRFIDVSYSVDFLA